MTKIVVSLFGVFIVLHGLVHLLYVAQSQRLFELQPGMDWPAGSWALSGPLGEGVTRLLGSLAFGAVAAALVAGGAGLLLRVAWWRPPVVGAAALSAVVILLLWDGTLHSLNDQGLLGLLIDGALLITVLVLRWPGL